jgi:hypothetical protein
VKRFSIIVSIDQCCTVSIGHGHGRDWPLPFSQFWPISNDNQDSNLVTARPVTVGHEHRDADPQYILSYKSRNFGQFLDKFFSIRLILASKNRTSKTANFVLKLADMKNGSFLNNKRNSEFWTTFWTYFLTSTYTQVYTVLILFLHNIWIIQ